MFVGAAGAQTEERADVATLLHDLQHATSWSRQAECARALAATRVPDVEVLAALLRHITTSSVPALAAAGRSVPRFCQREAAAFMRCGILAHGFARVHCDGCGQDDIVAFSCKGRGFCPFCGAARMADTAVWLVDAVIPEVPVRQWVLSLPYRVRALCAYDPAACALVRAVAGLYERTARRAGVPPAWGGVREAIHRPRKSLLHLELPMKTARRSNGAALSRASCQFVGFAAPVARTANDTA